MDCAESLCWPLVLRVSEPTEQVLGVVPMHPYRNKGDKTDARSTCTNLPMGPSSIASMPKCWLGAFWSSSLMAMTAVAGAALPAIMKEMGVEAATAGFMASSALFGMMFGAIFLGALSDKIGRRWTISLCVFLFSVFTAAAGLTKDPVTFSIARFIAGLGIGGVMPNITAQMTEYAPKRIRSFLTTVMFSGYAIGGILAAVLGKQFIAQFGWQIVFFAAGVPVLLIPFILKSMPESLSFWYPAATVRNCVRSSNPSIRGSRSAPTIPSVRLAQPMLGPVSP